MWKQLVSEGRLPGNAATPLPPLNPYELVLRILRGISPEENPYLFTNWYSFFPMLLEMDAGQAEATEDVKNELRHLLCQPLVFLALEQDTLLAPEEEYVDEDRPAHEWLAPYFKWQQTKDRDPETLFYRIVNAFNRRYTLPQYTEPHEQQGVQFYLALALLRASRFAEAEEAVREAAPLMEQDPQLRDYYRKAEQKWHK